jgi:archaellum component FlaC
MTEVKDKSDTKIDMEKPFNIEERMGRVEGALGQMGKRLDNVETGIGELRGEIGDMRKHVDTELSGIERRDGRIERRDGQQVCMVDRNNDNRGYPDIAHDNIQSSLKL